MTKNLTSILALVICAALITGGISYALTNNDNATPLENMTIIDPVQNVTPEEAVTIINNYDNSVEDNSVETNVETNVNTTIINNGVPATVATVEVESYYGDTGVSVKLDENTVIAPDTPAPVAQVIEEVPENTGGLIISDLFLGSSKKPCEYVNITNQNNFTAYLNGMILKEEVNGRTFILGDVSIQPGKTLKIYSAQKAARDTIYSLGLPKNETQNGGIWNNEGDTAYLICGYDGSVISEFTR
jgi:hypothetical protein